MADSMSMQDRQAYAYYCQYCHSCGEEPESYEDWVKNGMRDYPEFRHFNIKKYVPVFFIGVMFWCAVGAMIMLIVGKGCWR